MFRAWSNLLITVILLSSSHLSLAVERIERGNLVIENIPPISDEVKDSISRYQSSRNAEFRGWIGNNNILIKTRFFQTNQVHWLEQPGAARQQLTFFKEPVGTVTVAANSSDGFVFAKDVGGAEFFQLFYFNMSTRKYTMITDGRSRNGGVAITDDGSKIAYFSTARNDKDWDIYVAERSDLKISKRVLTKTGAWIPVDWSSDNQKLIVRKYTSINESKLYVLNVDSGQLTAIGPDQVVSYTNAVFGASSNELFYSSDEDGEYQKLYYFNLVTQEKKLITQSINWDIEQLIYTNNGSLFFTVNDGGYSRLYQLNNKTFNYQLIEGLPDGRITNLSLNSAGQELAFSLQTATKPRDAYSLNLATLKLQQWTYSEIGGLDTNRFTAPTRIEYSTFDQVGGVDRKIPAFYFRPKQEKQKSPVVIHIHGGPEGQYRAHFSEYFQYLVNELRVAVIAPNVRGSRGYGKSYLQLDNGYKREDSVKDIGALLDWIAKQPELDANRVSVYGGSYGGYMVLASMVNYNERLACGVDVVGISNFVTFLENTKDYRRDLRRQEYGDERDPDMRAFLEKISPLTNVNKITKPLLVVQGKNDPRVPVTEAEQMVKAIRENKGEVSYLLAKDEGHGFRKKVNRDYYYQATSVFLQDCLF